MTNALVKLVKSTGKKVYFLVGHNERPIAGESEEEAFASAAESYGRAAAALTNETYAVESLLLTSLGAVPADASAGGIAGPTRPYLPHELAALDAGLGALFFGLFDHAPAVARCFGVPPDREPIGTIALGWPAPDAASSASAGRSADRARRPLADLVHRGRW